MQCKGILQRGLKLLNIIPFAALNHEAAIVISVPPPSTLASPTLSGDEVPFLTSSKLRAALKRKGKVGLRVPMSIEPLQLILPLPGSALPMPSSLFSLRQSILSSLSPGLFTPSNLPLISIASPLQTSPRVLATPLSPEKAPVIAYSLMAVGTSKDDTGSSSSPISSLPSNSSPSSLDLLVARTIDATRECSTPFHIPMPPSFSSTSDSSVLLMSEEYMDIFEAQMASLFDISSPTQAAISEIEPLILANSLLEIIESSSTAREPSLPQVDLGTYLDLLKSFSRIPFEALKKPNIKNGFLKCCKVFEQSNMAFASHLSQAAATIDFYINICHMAKVVEEELLKDKGFISQIHTEVFELNGQHSFASQLRTKLLQRKAQLEEELAAVNLALDQNAKRLQTTNQGLADIRQEMAKAIQLFPSLRSRESIVKEQLKHCTDFWANLWLHILKSL